MLPTKFSTRVQMLIALRGFTTVAELARDLGYARSEKLARVMRSHDAAPNAEVLADVAKKYVNLNLKWWLTGHEQPTLDHGDRLMTQEELDAGIHRIPNPAFAENDRPSDRPTPKKEGGSVRSDLSKAAEPPGVWYKPAMVTVDQDGEPNIVMLDAQAAAGLPANFSNPEYFAGKPAFRIPGYRYSTGTLVAVQIIGDSMHPTIGHEDWVIARHLEDPLRQLREGYVHLLVARDGVVAKRLFKAPDGSGFLCRSDNELYPPYELPYSEAFQVYMVMAVLSEDLSNKGADLRERLSRVEKDVLALQAKFNKR